LELKTPTIPSIYVEEILYKEKNSKFFGSAYPIQSEDEVKLIIDGLRKKHPHAGHFCYAYQIGTAHSYRANDGEPSNSAGMPIYGQILSFSHKHTCSGSQSFGVKLGVGGLISAYKTTAQHTRKL
jgi:putative IMPACT (imprinted ancient) family translation regulator